MENSIPALVTKDAPPSRASPKKGGWRAIKYILANETFEKLASMSLVANMTLYLTTKYNMNTLQSVNVMTIWNGTTNMAPLVGAFLADAFLGRFRTLLFGSFALFMGMVIMTLTAGIPQLRPPACPDKVNCLEPQAEHLAVLFTALGLLVVGAGGIRPCNIAFGADQLDTKTAKGRARLESFFNWWYFLFTIALIVAIMGVVYVQTIVSWVIGFAIPTVFLALSIAIFLSGRKTYINSKPNGSVFTDMVKVIVAAWYKRKLTPGQSLYNPGSDSEVETESTYTNRFKCLEKAAVVSGTDEFDEEGKAKNSWRLCSLKNVEELKSVIAIVPVWLSGVACFVAMDQQSTFGILQAIQMNKSIGPKFQVPPAWMGLSSMIALSIWIFIYEKVYLSLTRKATGKEKRLTMQQRISIGIIMSILCMLVAGFVERARRESAVKHQSFESPLTVAMLLPQYALSGLTEAFNSVAIMELLSTQMPESLRTIAGAIFFLSISFASYISTVLINIIHNTTGGHGKWPWLGGQDLNMNKLENHYFIVAAVGALNFVYFIVFARHFMKNVSASKGNGKHKSKSGNKGGEKHLEMRDIA